MWYISGVDGVNPKTGTFVEVKVFTTIVEIRKVQVVLLVQLVGGFSVCPCHNPYCTPFV